MRGAARGLIVAVAVLVPLALTASGSARAQSPDFTRAIRALDGGQFLEDEPIWVCDPTAPAPAAGARFTFHGEITRVDQVGKDKSPLRILGASHPEPRSGELSHAVVFPLRSDLHPLDVGAWSGGGLRAGTYEVAVGGRNLARFRVIAPRASEAAVRAALARAARLSRATDESKRADAARLYEAVFERYPRTSYLTSIYAGMWRLRAFTTRYSSDPSLWLEAVFAQFHDSCFGVWALDRYMEDVPVEQARPRLRKLVGLYPDTRLSRAATAYL